MRGLFVTGSFLRLDSTNPPPPTIHYHPVHPHRSTIHHSPSQTSFYFTVGRLCQTNIPMFPDKHCYFWVVHVLANNSKERERESVCEAGRHRWHEARRPHRSRQTSAGRVAAGSGSWARARNHFIVADTAVWHLQQLSKESDRPGRAVAHCRLRKVEHRLY